MSKMYIYPTKQQIAVYTNDPDESENKAADAIKVTTLDNASNDFDICTWYHIKPENVITLFENYRTQPIEQIQSSAIRAAIRQAASNVGTQYTAFQLMGVSRTEASKKLTAELKSILEPRGITVDRAEFAGNYPNESLLNRITNQVNAETELTIAEIKREIAEEDKAIEITRASALSQSSGLKALQTRGKSLELLNLEADIDALRKWNGELTPIRLRKGQSVILTGDAIQALMGGKQ